MKNIQKIKNKKIVLRKARIRSKIFGSQARPRLAVFRSSKHIYGQLIDDENGRTLLSFSDLKLSHKKSDKIPEGYHAKERTAYLIGRALAEMAEKKKIKNVIFDRHQYRYHGRIKALAEGARAGGLIF